MALTPAAVLMFRFNNPDALLTLLLVRRGLGAPPRPRERPAALGGAVARVLVGLGLQHQVPAGLPGAAGVRGRVYCSPRAGLAAASGRWRGRRAWPWSLASGWWVAAVELIPGRSAAVHRRQHQQLGDPTAARLRRAGADPGLVRLRRGNDRGAGPRGGGGIFGGAPGLLRMFNPEFGGQIAWLLFRPLWSAWSSA